MIPTSKRRNRPGLSDPISLVTELLVVDTHAEPLTKVAPVHVEHGLTRRCGWLGVKGVRVPAL